MKIILSTVTALLILSGCSSTPEEEISTTVDPAALSFPSENGRFYRDCDVLADRECVNSSEQVHIFQHYAALDERGEMVITLGGWLYESNANFFTRLSLVTLLETQMGTIDEEPADFERRIDPFLADGQSNEKVYVQIGSEYYEAGVSDSTGDFNTTIRLSAEAVALLDAEAYAQGHISYRVVLDADDSRDISGDILIQEPSQTLVVSDIDDTLKRSEVYISKRELLRNTFINAPEPVDVMKTLYQQLELEEGALQMYYVSGSPKALGDFLEQFLEDEGFAEGSLYLRDFSFNPLSGELYDFISSDGTFEHKVQSISHLLEQFPSHQFILLGDSGEKDPEVYGALLSLYGAQIKQVYIHNVTAESLDNSRFQDAYSGDTSKVTLIEANLE